MSISDERPRDVRAAEVEPGMMLHNPYGGDRGGWFTAAAAPREAGDGSVEIDAEDGRTARFRPRFRLDLDWRGMDARQAQAEHEEPELEAG